MGDPTRLLDGDSAMERALLGAWSARQPSDVARLRTLAAVGVGSFAVAAGLGTGLAGAGASVAPKAIVASSLLKWLAVAGVVAGGVAATAGVVVYVNLHDKPLAPVAPAAPETTATAVVRPLPAPPPPAPSTRAVAPAPSSTIEPVDPFEPTSPDPPPSPLPTSMAPPTMRTIPSVAPSTASAKTAPPPSSLDEQVATLDRARRTLASGDANGALQLVDAYDARFPDGSLAQESTEVRIEALYRMGSRAEADKLATKFLAAHPTSPYARVLRSLQAGASPSSAGAHQE